MCFKSSQFGANLKTLYLMATVVHQGRAMPTTTNRNLSFNNPARLLEGQNLSYRARSSPVLREDAKHAHPMG